MTTTTKQAAIAALNDDFRSKGPRAVPGRMFVTSGIAALSPQTQAKIVAKVQTFDAFTEDNDPHGEHDFGSLDVQEAGRVFWKIDYYADADMDAGAEDPAAPCFRVLTIMLASEY